MNKKFLVIGIIIIAIVLGTITIIVLNKKDNTVENFEISNSSYITTNSGEKVNTNENIKKEKMLNGLKITNIQLSENKDNKTTLLAKVENTNKDATELKFIEIIILDEDGKEVEKANGMIVALEPGEETQLNVHIPKGNIDAYDFKIIEK